MASAFEMMNKRAVRSAVNPLDVSTVVSILPLAIKEIKRTIQPGVYPIAKGSFEKPATLLVGSSSYWIEPFIDQPLVEIQVGSVVIAESIVKDYCNGLIGCDMSTRMPGLFFVPGNKSPLEIKKEYPALLEQARIRQRAWYMELVSMADDFWAKSNGSPRVISDLMKIAAEELQVNENKAWMKDFSTVEMQNCPACGTLLNPAYPMCSNCKTIVDKKRYEALGLSKAI